MGDTLRQFLWAVTAVIDIHEVRPHRIVTHLDASTSILGHQQLDFASSGDKLAVCSGTSFMIYTTTTWTGRNVDAACNGIVFTADGRELAVAQTVPKEHLDRPDFEYYDVDTLTSVRHLYTWASKGTWSPTGPNPDVRTWKSTCSPRFTKSENVILVDDDPKNAFHIQSFALAPNSKLVSLSGEISNPCPKEMFPVTHNYATIIVDPNEHRLLRVLRARILTPVVWSPDSRYLAYADYKTEPTDTEGGAIEVVIADAMTGATISSNVMGKTSTKIGHGYSINALHFTPDGSNLILWTGDGVEIWDSRLTKRSQKISTGAAAIAFSADGRYMALSGEPATLAAAFGILAELILHPNGVGGRVVVLELKR
jgi:WD40 repeat protein